MDYKKKIQERGLKQRWIASQLGVSHEILNKWVNNKVDMPETRRGELEKLLT